jgi:hypothetical protein
LIFDFLNNITWGNFLNVSFFKPPGGTALLRFAHQGAARREAEITHKLISLLT